MHSLYHEARRQSSLSVKLSDKPHIKNKQCSCTHLLLRLSWLSFSSSDPAGLWFLLWSSIFVTVVAKKYRFIQFELDMVFDTHWNYEGAHDYTWHMQIPPPSDRVPPRYKIHIDLCIHSSRWSYVKKKYKLNMPFLVLSYPAKASALLSNAA